jgi:hypothetical protein
VRISPYGSFSPTSTSTSTSSQAGGSPWIKRPDQHPLGALLFGKRPPKLVDRRKYPSLGKALKKLDLSKQQIAEALGAPEAFFSVELCEGDNASINQNGQIAFGLELLDEHQNENELLVGVLAHEIGHQPWSWPKGDLSKLTKKQLDQLYKDEEAKADRFAGRALADLGLSPDALCDLLLSLHKFESHPPSDYYPAPVRAQMIREVFSNRKGTLDRAAHLSTRIMNRRRELR